jgi:hypothetical protein
VDADVTPLQVHSPGPRAEQTAALLAALLIGSCLLRSAPLRTERASANLLRLCGLVAYVVLVVSTSRKAASPLLVAPHNEHRRLDRHVVADRSGRDRPCSSGHTADGVAIKCGQYTTAQAEDGQGCSFR